MNLKQFGWRCHLLKSILPSLDPPCKFIGSDPPPLFSPRNEPIMYILNPRRKALRA